MGGQTSRMLRSIAEDSTYIIRQTNHTTYQRSRVAHEEVQSKLEDLRRLKHEMLQSAERDAQRSHVFESFQHTVGKHKQALDEQVRTTAIVAAPCSILVVLMCYIDGLFVRLWLH